MLYLRILHSNVRLICFFAIFWGSGIANAEESDESASPYFYVQGGDDALESFPLKSTYAKVMLNGKIANVKLIQVFSNLGVEAINASYIFPGSTRAAVNGMVMTIGDRRVVAKIKEKEQAKATFEKAKAAGKSASLLAQKRPNVFSMDVANILPGDEIKVELTYTEILSAEEGEYEFVLPGVVGPRFGGDAHLSSSETAWVSNPYLSTEDLDKDPVRYTIDLEMKSPIAIQNLRSTTHSPQIDWQDESSATIFIEGDAESVGNRDFILNYHLQDKTIVSGLSHYTWEGENYFMLVAEPPKRVLSSQVTDREYLFVVDVSGSMNGFPLEVSSRVMEELLTGMRSTDRFNILFFAGGSQTLSSVPLEANETNIQSGLQMMRSMRGGGGTQLYSAMQTALKMPRVEGISRSIVVVSDGYISAEDAVFRLIDKNLNDTNVFAFGIGSSVNRHLIEGIAKAGQAESFVVTSKSGADKQTKRFVDYVSTPVLTNIKITSPNADIYDLASGSLPDMLGERPILALGKYKPHGRKPVDFVLKGNSADGEKEWKFKIEKRNKDRSLPQLWARKRLESLYVVPQGSSVETKETITELGLKYNLLTKFTSFVAVDEVIRNPDGKAKNVKQPLPLPKGVSNLAVGQGHRMPEPEVIWLVMMLLIVWGYQQRQVLFREIA